MSTAQTGVIFAVFALVVFITSPLFGVHMAAIGQRRLMFAGAQSTVSCILVCPARPADPMLFFGRRPDILVDFDHPLRLYALRTRRCPIYCLLLHAAVLPGALRAIDHWVESHRASPRAVHPPGISVAAPPAPARVGSPHAAWAAASATALLTLLCCRLPDSAQGLGAAAVETSAYAITANLFPDAISYMMGLLEARMLARSSSLLDLPCGAFSCGSAQTLAE